MSCKGLDLFDLHITDDVRLDKDGVQLAVITGSKACTSRELAIQALFSLVSVPEG